MPLHYVITDALVLAVAAGGAGLLLRRRQPLAAGGMLLFALAALLGVIRISTGAEGLAPIHRLVSQAGGLIGLLLLLSALVSSRGWTGNPWPGLLVAALGGGLALLLPAAIAPVFLLGLVIATVLASTAPCVWRFRLPAVIGSALMIPNLVLVRNSAALGPDVSWHLYHLIVAAWLLAIALLLTARRAQSTATV